MVDPEEDLIKNNPIEKLELELSITDQLLSGYTQQNNAYKNILGSFLKKIPELPKNPDDAFISIKNYLIENGFTYDTHTFALEDVIREKRGNCLGLSVLIGLVLIEQGFDVKYEISFNPKDAVFRDDIRYFNRLVNCEEFSYDNIPNLPTGKYEHTSRNFTALGHPILIIEGVKYEVTSLDYDDPIHHGYESESIQVVTFRNLLGAIMSSKVKTIFDKATYHELQYSINRALKLWPENNEALFMLHDLATENFDDNTAQETENKILDLKGDSSLYYFSLYKMTRNEECLDKALEKYPAYIEAFLYKKVRPPFKNREEVDEAKFNLTIATLCIAKSVDIDLDKFYFRNISLIKEVFGEEYASGLLYNIEADEKHPLDYFVAMYTVTNDKKYLIEAIKSGIFEKCTPLNLLNICTMFIKITKDDHTEEIVNLRNLCKYKLDDLERDHKGSSLFIKSKEVFIK